MKESLSFFFRLNRFLLHSNMNFTGTILYMFNVSLFVLAFCKIGSGLILRNGGSAGGTDILGMYFAKKYPNFSVGKIQNIISEGVYYYYLMRYDIQTVVYSAIYLFVVSFVIDKTHTQNIKSSAIIFTKHLEVQDCILNNLKRGATRWTGEGCYNKTDSYRHRLMTARVFYSTILPKRTYLAFLYSYAQVEKVIVRFISSIEISD